MYVAIWKGTEIAKSDRTIEIERNQYFPPEDVHMEYLRETTHQTTCPWKGLASYYSVEVDGEVNENAAWFYKQPKEKATQITDYVAFWKGVEVKKV